MRSIMVSLLMAFCYLSGISYAAEQVNFQQGKDYKIIKAQADSGNTSVNQNQVLVEEFFNYGCGACYSLEPALEKWRQEKPKDVLFVRTPVVFHSQWEMYAKTYYIIQALKLNDKLSGQIFAAVHDPKLAKEYDNLQTTKSMEKFFVDHGVKAETFAAAYNYSPQIDANVKQGMNRMQRYGIYSVPTLVVAGKYQTDLQLAYGDKDRVIQILSYLIKKSQSEKTAKTS